MKQDQNPNYIPQNLQQYAQLPSSEYKKLLKQQQKLKSEQKQLEQKQQDAFQRQREQLLQQNFDDSSYHSQDGDLYRLRLVYDIEKGYCNVCQTLVQTTVENHDVTEAHRKALNLQFSRFHKKVQKYKEYLNVLTPGTQIYSLAQIKQSNQNNSSLIDFESYVNQQLTKNIPAYSNKSKSTKDKIQRDIGQLFRYLYFKEKEQLTFNDIYEYLAQASSSQTLKSFQGINYLLKIMGLTSNSCAIIERQYGNKIQQAKGDVQSKWIPLNIDEFLNSLDKFLEQLLGQQQYELSAYFFLVKYTKISRRSIWNLKTSQFNIFNRKIIISLTSRTNKLYQVDIDENLFPEQLLAFIRRTLKANTQKNQLFFKEQLQCGKNIINVLKNVINNMKVANKVDNQFILFLDSFNFIQITRVLRQTILQSQSCCLDDDNHSSSDDSEDDQLSAGNQLKTNYVPKLNKMTTNEKILNIQQDLNSLIVTSPFENQSKKQRSNSRELEIQEIKQQQNNNQHQVVNEIIQFTEHKSNITDTNAVMSKDFSNLIYNQSDQLKSTQIVKQNDSPQFNSYFSQANQLSQISPQLPSFQSSQQQHSSSGQSKNVLQIDANPPIISESQQMQLEKLNPFQQLECSEKTGVQQNSQCNLILQDQQLNNVSDNSNKKKKRRQKPKKIAQSEESDRYNLRYRKI